MKHFPKILTNNWLAILVYSVVSLLLLWPLLGPGYILTLDMVFSPNLKLPDTITSSYIFHAGLHVLNFVLPSDVIQKLLLLAILVLSGLGMHRLVRSLQQTHVPVKIAQWGSYASGLLYMVNPFTYSRFMAGQYSVLLGYSLLPFFVVAVLRFFKNPSLKQSILLTIVTVAISIVSIHTLGLILIIALVALLQTVWRERSNKIKLVQLAQHSAIVTVAFVVLSCYWLVPLIQGSGAIASSIATFQSTDQSAFATGGEGIGGKIMHTLRLQGFWGERNNMFLLPSDELNLWGLVVVLIWALVITGGVVAWKQKRETSMLFVVSIIVATLLATGVGSSWLTGHIPFFAGYREPQKFVALIALGYAVFIGFAVPKLLMIIKSKVGRLTIGIFLAMVLIGFTPVMFRGFDGQLTPRQYPPDWATLNQQLNKDTDNFHVLFLPWHLYMRYEFTGRIIASPVEGYFDKPFIVSDNPEIGNVTPAIADVNKQLLTTTILPHAPQSTSLGHQLLPLNVKYIVLAKDDDYQTYSYLNNQSDIQLVSETDTLMLYRNNAFKEGNK